MADRDAQRAARRIQAECGTSYTTALNFFLKHRDEIVAMTLSDGKINWKELPAAACSLWRRQCKP